jgi:hypothetical protein
MREQRIEAVKNRVTYTGRNPFTVTSTIPPTESPASFACSTAPAPIPNPIFRLIGIISMTRSVDILYILIVLCFPSFVLDEQRERCACGTTLE